jgi:hypothetical protein
MTLATGTQLGPYEHINPVAHSAQNFSGSLSIVETAKECSDSGCCVGPVGLQAGVTESRGDSARELVERVGHISRRGASSSCVRAPRVLRR